MQVKFDFLSFYFTQVTRSIGDDDLKPAVIAEPEVTESNLSAEDEFLVRNFTLCTVICMKFVIFWVPNHVRVGFSHWSCVWKMLFWERRNS